MKTEWIDNLKVLERRELKEGRKKEISEECFEYKNHEIVALLSHSTTLPIKRSQSESSSWYK